MTRLTAEVASIKALADEFVAASSDPDLAMVAFLKVWSLGAAAQGAVRTEVLDDLVELAVTVAYRTGREMSLVQVLEDAGYVQRAARVRAAVDAGRARHLEAAASAARLLDLRVAREVIHA